MMDQRIISALSRGVGWTCLVFFGRRFITFLGTLVLARIVGPEAFGLFAAALLFVSYIDAFSDGGVGLALVQNPAGAEQVIKPAFAVSLITSLTLSVLFFLAAPFMAAFFDQPELTPVLRLLSPIFLLSAFSSVQDGWLKRHFRFAARVVPQILRAVTKAVVSISLALAGFGVWSLVWGQLAGQVAGAMAYFRVSKQRPGLRVDRALSLALLGFGLQISFITLIGILGDTMDKLIIGRALSPAELGVYAIGAALPEMIVLGICVTVGQVVFPAFSRVQGRPRLVRAGFHLALRYVNILTLGAATGLAIIARDFITLAYSDPWQGAVPVIQILAVAAALKSITFNAGDVFKAIGRPRVLIYLLVLNLALSVPILIIAVRYGITGIASARLVIGILMAAVTLLVARHLLGVSLRSILGSLRTPVLAAALMVLACELTKLLLADSAVALRLGLTVLVGALVYGLVIYLRDPGLVRAVLGRRGR
jgi:PST family polysaccharide transporter